MTRSHEPFPNIPEPGEAASAPPSFEALIKAARFTNVDGRFRPEYEAEQTPDLIDAAKFQDYLLGTWRYKGDRVRGRFEVIEMQSTRPYNEYSVFDARAEAARVPGRHLATAYELVAFAALGVANNKTLTDPSDTMGWNGSDIIGGFGSCCIDVAYREPYPEIPALWAHVDLGRRDLVTVTTGYLQRKFIKVLCVVEPPTHSGSEHQA